MAHTISSPTYDFFSISSAPISGSSRALRAKDLKSYIDSFSWSTTAILIMRVHRLFAASLSARAVAINIQVTPQTKVIYGEVDSALEGDLKLISQYAGAAYCVTNYFSNATDVLCVEGVCPEVISANAADFLHHISLISNENGFVAIDPIHKLVVLALVGSVTLRNWIVDSIFSQSPCVFGVGCLIHTGFNNAWLEIQAAFVSAIHKALQENPEYKLVITGHSLGGAVATVAAASLRVFGYPCDLYTFGSPRVFNSVGADFISSQPGGNFRVTHFDDPVPRLPPLLFDYRHTSPEYWLPLGNATRTDYDPSQIAVCFGNANVNCNAKFWNFNTLSHSYYFEHLTACYTSGFILRRKLEDLHQDKWTVSARADAEYFQRLHGVGVH